MAVIGLVLFSTVFAVSIWAIVDTVAPRLAQIAALLDGSAFAPVRMPVAARRTVRRLEPARTYRRSLRAAA